MTMLIDMNAYLGHWPFRKLRHNTAPELVALMDDRGIDLACVSSASAIFYKNSQAGNEDLAAEVADYPGRLIPFAVINPTSADWEHDLSVCAEEFGVKRAVCDYVAGMTDRFAQSNYAQLFHPYQTL